jgi:hypothetical protein
MKVVMKMTTQTFLNFQIPSPFTSKKDRKNKKKKKRTKITNNMENLHIKPQGFLPPLYPERLLEISGKGTRKVK